MPERKQTVWDLTDSLPMALDLIKENQTAFAGFLANAENRAGRYANAIIATCEPRKAIRGTKALSINP